MNSLPLTWKSLYVDHDLSLSYACSEIRTGCRALSRCEKHVNLPKLCSLLKTGADRGIITAEILPRGSENSPWPDYFQSKQTGLWGVCWIGAGRWEGELGRSWGAFLCCLCRGIREDQGNEIGQWKGYLDGLRLKLCFCYPWLLLGDETESFRRRHTDTQDFHSKISC